MKVSEVYPLAPAPRLVLGTRLLLRGFEDEYILASTGIHTRAAISLRDGNRYREPVEVKSFREEPLTHDEAIAILGPDLDKWEFV